MTYKVIIMSVDKLLVVLVPSYTLIRLAYSRSKSYCIKST